MSKFGRYQTPESPRALLTAHFHQGGPLRVVDHEPKVAVLDQEDLIAQGIDTSVLIPGAQKVDALGSCTANANTEALSNLLDQAHFYAVTGIDHYEDTVGAEKFAIRFYHACTDQTGRTSEEWPPTDCGSSGPYIVKENERQNLCGGDVIAHGAQNIVSLMQSAGCLLGTTWLNAWMEPDAAGFIDGNGSSTTLQAQIKQGVAGGHELYLSAIEKLALTETGIVIPESTVLRIRNHWTPSWGDHGSARLHLSTIVALGQYIDIRQLQGA